MAKNTKLVTTFVIIGILAMIGLVGYGVYMLSVQQTAFEEREELDIPSTLEGKAATVDAYAYDQAANNPSTTQAAVPLYLITSPVVTSEKISGNFAADGTALSTSSRTSITEGLNVGDKYVAVAVNDTYYGVVSDVKTISSQSETLDLDVYATASSGSITLKDEDENTIAEDGAGTNLTLGASESESFDELKIKNDNTDVAWNVGGFFVGMVDDTNMSSMTGEGTSGGDYSVSYSKSGSLERTSADDIMWEFSEPVMLLEYDYVTITDLQVKADGDGCSSTGETWSIYVFDKTWFRSGKENALKIGAEDDTDSPSDVGIGDVSASYYCTA